jgi:diguanylate cyclase (GGDEF)-like protein
MIRREGFLYEPSGAARPWQFQDAMRREISRGRRYGTRFSFALVGIDNVEKLTAKIGPNTMAILRERVADLVLRETRTTDVVAHLGHGKIGALLPETPPEGAYLLAERVRRHVGRVLTPTALQHGEAVHVSIGVSAWRDAPSVSVDSLMKEAEDALLTAQSEGGNRSKVYLVA